MNATLGPDWRRFKKQIHQQGLSAPDRAMDVKAARRLDGLDADQAFESVGRLGWAVAGYARQQSVEPFDQRDLRRIGLEPARRGKLAIALPDRNIHRARWPSVSD